MRTRLPLAILLLGSVSVPFHGQIHSPQVNLARKPHRDDLSWLWQYTQPPPHGDENALVLNPRFKTFLHRHLTAPQSFWNADTGRSPKPLADVALDFLAVPGDVVGEDNRYLTADGCVQHFCPDRGLLWVDLGLPRPLVAFAAIDWITENRATDDKNATYTMWVFSSRALDASQLPPSLVRSIRRWTTRPSSGSTDLQNITRVFLVDPDGSAHPLTPSDIGAHTALPPETTTGMQLPKVPNS